MAKAEVHCYKEWCYFEVLYAAMILENMRAFKALERLIRCKNGVDDSGGAALAKMKHQIDSWTDVGNIMRAKKNWTRDEYQKYAYTYTYAEFQFFSVSIVNKEKETEIGARSTYIVICNIYWTIHGSKEESGIKIKRKYTRAHKMHIERTQLNSNMGAGVHLNFGCFAKKNYDIWV